MMTHPHGRSVPPDDMTSGSIDDGARQGAPMRRPTDDRV
jgi:hypothetical protein